MPKVDGVRRAARAHRGRRLRVQVLAVRVRRAPVPPDRRRRPAGGVRGARGRRGARRRAQRAAGGGRAPPRAAARRPRGRRARARRVPPAGLGDRRLGEALDFAYWTGARLHLAHCTHPHTFRLSSSTGELGAAVSGETCVHYLAAQRGRTWRGWARSPRSTRRSATRSPHEELWALLRRGRDRVGLDRPRALADRDEAAARSWTRRRACPGLESFLAGMVTAGLRRGLPAGRT